MLVRKLMGAKNVVLAFYPALPKPLPEWVARAPNLAEASGRIATHSGNSFVAGRFAGQISCWIDQGLTPRKAARKTLNPATPEPDNH